MTNNKYAKVSYIVFANLEILTFFFELAKTHCHVQRLLVKVLTSCWFSTYAYTIYNSTYNTIHNTINNTINNIPFSFRLICTWLFPINKVTPLTSSKNVKKANVFFLLENENQIFILYEIRNHRFGIVLYILKKKKFKALLCNTIAFFLKNWSLILNCLFYFLNFAIGFMYLDLNFKVDYFK